MRSAAWAVGWVTVLLTVARPVAQSPEELARRQFESGQSFLQAGKFAEALRDFGAVVEAYPTSTVADDALLEIARHQLEVARDLTAAQTAVDTLLKKYPAGDASPLGYVLAGRIALGRGRAAADVESALANFERVPRLFPGTDAVPAALQARAETLRLTGRCQDAVPQYAQVVQQYPGSVWAPQAHIGTARCLSSRGQSLEALAALQQATSHPLAGPSAAEGRQLATILARFVVRPPQPVYAFSGRALGGSAGRVKDVRALALSGADLHVLAEGGLAAHVAATGAMRGMARIEEGRGVFTDRDGQPVVVAKAGLVVSGGRLQPLSVPKPDKSLRVLEDMTAGVALSTGEVIVADRDGPALHRFGRDFKLIGPFGAGRADRMAVSTLDHVALADTSARTITVVSRDGRPVARVPDRGTGWKFESVTDIAFDALDSLYVLDRDLATVFVFAVMPQVRLVASFTLAERAPGAFARATALAVDGAGRLYIADDRAERVQVYQ